jgi:hypothetical protein
MQGDICVVVLGMNEVAVHRRFQAIHTFERELNITGKIHSILHSVSQLIDTIDLDSPFDGEPLMDALLLNTKKTWLSYMGVSPLENWEVGDAIGDGCH